MWKARQHWLPVLPVCVLLVVAVQQIVLTRSEGLNPWKGGGFGMFATADRGSLRMIKVYDVASGEQSRVFLSDDVEVLRRAAQELPSDFNLRALVEALPGDSAAPFTRRVEVWRARFDLERHEWRREAMKVRTYKVVPGDRIILDETS